MSGLNFFATLPIWIRVCLLSKTNVLDAVGVSLCARTHTHTECSCNCVFNWTMFGGCGNVIWARESMWKLRISWGNANDGYLIWVLFTIELLLVEPANVHWYSEFGICIVEWSRNFLDTSRCTLWCLLWSRICRSISVARSTGNFDGS